jgi:hypothetical protein
MKNILEKITATKYHPTLWRVSVDGHVICTTTSVRRALWFALTHYTFYGVSTTVARW